MEGLAAALRYLRIFHDMGQSEAAGGIGISAPYLSQLESGKKTPTIDVVASYAKFFDVPVSSILVLAERLQSGDFSYRGVESLVAAKILRILAWLQEKERTPKSAMSSDRNPSKKEPGRAKSPPAKQHRRAS